MIEVGCELIEHQEDEPQHEVVEERHAELVAGHRDMQERSEESGQEECGNCLCPARDENLRESRK